MPRLSHLVPPHKVRVSIPNDLYIEVEARLYSPRLQARQYGSLSSLICTLLREWLSRQPGTNATLEQRTNDQLNDL